MSLFLWTAGILIGIGLVYALGTYHEYIHLENAVRKFFETKETAYIHLENAVRKFFETKETASKDEILELLNDLENDL